MERKAMLALAAAAVIVVLAFLGATYALSGQQLSGQQTHSGVVGGSMMGRSTYGTVPMGSGQHSFGGVMNGYHGGPTQGGNMFSWCYERMLGYLNSALGGT